MKLKVREVGTTQRYVVTDGPRNHLVTIRRTGYLSELHYPAALFWASVTAGEFEIIKDKREGTDHA